jgi:hypothetical protein
MRYILSATPAEGSHNGSAAVLKTAGRKAMQVRVLSPPPLALNNFLVFKDPGQLFVTIYTASLFSLPKGRLRCSIESTHNLSFVS